MKGWKERGAGEAEQTHWLLTVKLGKGNVMVSPATVNFFLSPETDADISIYSFSSFRLLVKPLLVAKQQ